MRRISRHYSIRLALALLALFTLAHLTGAIHHPGLRVFNGVLHLGFVYLAVRKYRIEYPREWNYASGAGVGVVVGMAGTLLFVVAVGAFLGARPDVMADIAANTRLANYLNPFTAAAVLMVEGFAVSVFAAYFSMRVVDGDRAARRAAEAYRRSPALVRTREPGERD